MTFDKAPIRAFDDGREVYCATVTAFNRQFFAQLIRVAMVNGCQEATNDPDELFAALHSAHDLAGPVETIEVPGLPGDYALFLSPLTR